MGVADSRTKARIFKANSGRGGGARQRDALGSFRRGAGGGANAVPAGFLHLPRRQGILNRFQGFSRVLWMQIDGGRALQSSDRSQQGVEIRTGKTFSAQRSPLGIQPTRETAGTTGMLHALPRDSLRGVQEPTPRRRILSILFNRDRIFVLFASGSKARRRLSLCSMRKSRMNVRELADRALAADAVLIAMNIDGMVPGMNELKPRPARAPAWMVEAEPAFLRLERLPGVSLAVVSGGRYGELCSQTKRLRQLWRIAEHGALIGMPGGGCLMEPSAPALDVLASLGEGKEGTVRLEGVLLDGGATTGVAIHSLAVKERGRTSLLSALIDLSCRGRAFGMKLVSGRLVVEAARREHRVAGALARVLEALPPSVLPIYAGCGPSDKPAMALARERGGIRVAVGGGDRCPADVVMPSIEAWVEALWTIAEARTGRGAAGATLGPPAVF